VLSSERARENGLGRLQVIDIKGHVISAGSIMMRKLGAESKGEISKNIPL
jgi:ribosomal protein L27